MCLSHSFYEYLCRNDNRLLGAGDPGAIVRTDNDAARASVDSSLSEAQTKQTFRKQMVLFQHNQNRNSGRPCLLEITSNCNWDSARPSVLGRLFAVTADTIDYPPICTFIIERFRVEILPRTLQKTPIPLDLRSKLGVSKMHAVKVRITLDVSQEQQPQFNAPWPLTKSELSTGHEEDVSRPIGDKTSPDNSDLFTHCSLPQRCGDGFLA